jgi:two-component system OmpR family response regulator/two-component system response regulator QseB
MRVLLVEDDAQLGKAVQTGLRQQGHAVDWVRDGVTGEDAALSGDYGAILLDLGLPGQGGMQLLQKVRAAGNMLPVLIITARDEIAERVSGLDAGADDFLVKPFDLQELGARLRAATRRLAGRAETLIVHGTLRVNQAARTVVQDGAEVQLTAREFALLLQLLENRGRVQSRTQLQDALYSWSNDIESNAVEVHVHHLRRKLGRELIRTVHGQGYTIDELAVPGSAHAAN